MSASSTAASSNRRRWAVLAAVTSAQAVLACLFVALPVLAPMLKERFHLGIEGIGVLLASVNLGMTITLVPWGHLADRIGERMVLVSGLAVTAAALAGAAFAPNWGVLLAALTCVGVFGASVNAASTRAVLAWFDAHERGLALAIRQTSIPLGGAGFALVVPHIARGSDTETPFLVLTALAIAATGAVAAMVGRSSHVAGSDAAARVLRNRRLWRISGSAVTMLVGQTTIVGFSVLFLHERRGFSTAFAAAMLAACQVAGAVVLLAAGRLSDRLNTRIRPLRALGYAGGVALLALALAADAPSPVLLPLLVVAGALGFGWVVLSSAAAGESVPPEQMGAASGVQQAAMAISATLAPLLVSLVIGAAGWRLSFAVAAAGPILGAALLTGVTDATRATRRDAMGTLDPRLEGGAP